MNGKSRLTILAISLIATVLAGCGPSSGFAAVGAASVVHRPADLKYAGIKYNIGELDSCPAVQQTTAHFFGTASGRELNGQPYNSTTGCGYVFRPLTDNGAASWFYPCGTKLKVTNLANGKSATVTVMDRGPNTVRYPGVKIDLYRKIFLDLGGKIGQGGGGQMRVKVELISGSTSVQLLQEAVPSQHVLGGKCLVPYATSTQNSDYVCSVDCGMTWRSLSHPGICYKEEENE